MSNLTSVSLLTIIAQQNVEVSFESSVRIAQRFVYRSGVLLDVLSLGEPISLGKSMEVLQAYVRPLHTHSFSVIKQINIM